MKLKDVRLSAIEYCEKNSCNCTYISYDDTDEFYLTETEDKHTVFFVHKNGSLNACRKTEYALNFHKELRKRKKNRRRNDKRRMAELVNCEPTDNN